MARDTKERILEAALDIFARDGYAGANIKDMAESVGIVKSAFYRHYESKEEIWQAVLAGMAEYYEQHFGSVNHLPAIPQNTDALYAMTMRMVDFTAHDEKIIRVRKLLTTEQFRDDTARKLATNYFLNGTEAMFAKVFAGMMENGSLKKTDADILAFSYTAPITALIHLCDREPDKEAEAMEKLSAFVKQFIAVYGAEPAGKDA